MDFTQVHNTVRKRQSNNPWPPFLRRRSSEVHTGGTKKESFFLRMNGPRGRGRAETVITRMEEIASANPHGAESGVQSHRVTVNDRGSEEEAADNAVPEGDVGATRQEGAAVESSHSIEAATIKAEDSADVTSALDSHTAITGGSVMPDVDGAGRKDAPTSDVATSPVKAIFGGHSPERAGAGSDDWGPLAQLSKSMNLLSSSAKRGGGIKKVKDVAKKAWGALGLADEVEPVVQYECRFICLLLSVEEIVSALLGLQEI